MALKHSFCLKLLISHHKRRH